MRMMPSILRYLYHRCGASVLRAGAGALVLLLLAGIAGCNSDSATDVNGNPIGLPTGSFDIGIPTAVAVRQGASTILEVNILRSGYVAPIFVTVTGLPTGVTGPSVSSTSTNQLRLPLTADTLATLGPATATVTAQGSDVPTVTKQFRLTVGAR